MTRHRHVLLSIPILAVSLVLVALVAQPSAHAGSAYGVGRPLPARPVATTGATSSQAIDCPPLVPLRWSVLPVPAPRGESSPGDVLYGVATISPSDVWAVGADSTATGTLTEHWDGARWSVASGPAGSALNAVAGVASNDVWAVGYRYDSTLSTFQTLAEHWNGATWSAFTTPNDSTSENKLLGVAALSGANAWAVGYAENNNTSAIHALIEHWNGSSWSIVPAASPNDVVGSSLSAVTAISPSDIWAVGQYDSSQSQSELPLTEHWDGTSWSVVPSPGVSGDFFLQVNAVTATATNDVWAVGNFTTSQYGPWQTRIEHWNGTSWSVVPSPNPGTTSPDSVKLYGVAAPAKGNAWAVGIDQQSSGGSSSGEVPLVEHWNGSAWSLASSAALSAQFSFFDAASVVAGNTVMVVGQVTPQGASPNLGLAEYYAPVCLDPGGPPLPPGGSSSRHASPWHRSPRLA